MAKTRSFEHPEDVLAQWLDWDRQGGAALAAITHTEGGAVRAVGALMAVSRAGETAGYVSGGCIDADVALNAVRALETGRAAHLRYGAGSAFKDLPLPCGGAIEIAIFPGADREVLLECRGTLRNRLPARLVLESEGICFSADYVPRLRLRIAGRGADALALARLAESAGIETTLALTDREDRALAMASRIVTLETPTTLPASSDDASTAFVLMFHDGDWEIPLLRQALAGPAFYIGAVGSRKTQSRRLQALSDTGTPPNQSVRVRGPIGLVPSMRDASMLAVSTLAEIVAEYHAVPTQTLATTALVMLAAGQSSRFEAGDKLLAPLNGKPLIEHAAGLLSGERLARRIAVVGLEQEERAHSLERLGWETVVNANAADGQGTSLACAMEAIGNAPGIECVMVLLADMPRIPGTHLKALCDAMEPGVEAVMTSAGGVLGPPAIFHRSVLPLLSGLNGDTGARGVFDRLDQTRTVPLAPYLARDVDRVEDLLQLEETTDG